MEWLILKAGQIKFESDFKKDLTTLCDNIDDTVVVRNR